MIIENPFEESISKPVFSTVPVFEGEKGKTKLIATGSYFYIYDKLLFVTAGHVIRNHANNGLFISDSQSKKISLKGRQVYYFASEATNEPGGRDDQMDIAVMPLDNSMGELIPQNLITQKDIFYGTQAQVGYEAIMVGFPYKIKIDSENKVINCPMFIYNTHFVDKPAKAFKNASSNFNYLVKYKRRDVDHLGRKKITPEPQGISGGGVWIKNNKDEDWKLIGVPIEWDSNKSQILITRADQLLQGFQGVIEHLRKNS